MFSDFARRRVETGELLWEPGLLTPGPVSLSPVVRPRVCARKCESPGFKSRLCLSWAGGFSLLSTCSFGGKTGPCLPCWFGVKVTSDRRCEGVRAQAVTSDCWVSADQERRFPGSRRWLLFVRGACCFVRRESPLESLNEVCSNERAQHGNTVV